MEKEQPQLPAALVNEYGIVKSRLAYSQPQLGTFTYEIATKSANYLLKLVSPVSRYFKALKNLPLFALKCSRLSSFPKIVSHKSQHHNDSSPMLLMSHAGKPLTDYVTTSEGLKFKDLMNIFAQCVSALLDLARLGIKHYAIPLCGIYITLAKLVVITEILPDLTPVISFEDGNSIESDCPLPPEIWEEGASSCKEFTEAAHVFLIGHYFLRLINLNANIVNFVQNVSMEKTAVLAEYSREQMSFVLGLINRMADPSMSLRPTLHELLFYFRLFSLGNSGVASQLSTACSF